MVEFFEHERVFLDAKCFSMRRAVREISGVSIVMCVVLFLTLCANRCVGPLWALWINSAGTVFIICCISISTSIFLAYFRGLSLRIDEAGITQGSEKWSWQEVRELRLRLIESRAEVEVLLWSRLSRRNIPVALFAASCNPASFDELKQELNQFAREKSKDIAICWN